VTKRIGVVAPQTLIGEAVLAQLASAGFAPDHIVALADDPETVNRVDHGSTRLGVTQFADCDLASLDHVVIAASVERYGAFIKRAVAAGCGVAALAPLGEDSAPPGVITIPDSATLVARRLISGGSRAGQVASPDVVALAPPRRPRAMWCGPFGLWLLSSEFLWARDTSRRSVSGRCAFIRSTNDSLPRKTYPHKLNTP